jgi:hypothetical protein
MELFKMSDEQKIGRNDPCPCGSGKKYKKCCGASVAAESLADASFAADAEKERQAPFAEPTLEQWTQLYEVADNLKKLAPWEYLWDTDLVTLQLPERKEPVYCSVLGRNRTCFGISVYPGYESVQSFCRMAQAPKDEPRGISAFQQNCLVCYFGDRDELDPRDREPLKSLGIRFRGKNQWIYFRSMRPGYYPWFIDAGQADILIRALRNLAMACLHLIEGDLKVDFDGGETLLRFYDPEKDLWLNTAVRALPVPVVISKLVIDDESLITKLKKQKKSGMTLEFDVFYLPTLIKKHKDDTPSYPEIAVLVERNSGMPLAQRLSKPGDCMEDIALNMLYNHIMDVGRPTSISVRDKYTGRFLEDICEKIGVRLIEGQSMPAMNELIEQLTEVTRQMRPI